MKSANALMVAVVCGTVVSAWAHPPFAGTPTNSKGRPATGGGGATDSLPFSDNFDAYANGSGLAGQGGWVKWDPAASVDGQVSNAQSVSPSNSFKMVPQTDMVQTGTAITTGKWELKCMTYHPSTNVAPGVNDGGFVIGLNRFNSGGTGMTIDYWSAQIQFHAGSGTVRNYSTTTQSTPLISDQWVELRLVIDLATDKYDAYYNNINFITQHAWSTGEGTPGAISIGGFDFYGGNLATTVPFEMYFDNVSLTAVPAACYANCDGSSIAPILNSLDFGCFLTKFAAGDTYANCDGSTVPPTLNSLDFGCFLTKFAAGCT